MGLEARLPTLTVGPHLAALLRQLRIWRGSTYGPQNPELAATVERQSDRLSAEHEWLKRKVVEVWPLITDYGRTGPIESMTTFNLMMRRGTISAGDNLKRLVEHYRSDPRTALRVWLAWLVRGGMIAPEDAKAVSFDDFPVYRNEEAQRRADEKAAFDKVLEKVKADVLKHTGDLWRVRRAMSLWSTSDMIRRDDPLERQVGAWLYSLGEYGLLPARSLQGAHREARKMMDKYMPKRKGRKMNAREKRAAEQMARAKWAAGQMQRLISDCLDPERAQQVFNERKMIYARYNPKDKIRHLKALLISFGLMSKEKAATYADEPNEKALLPYKSNKMANPVEANK